MTPDDLDRLDALAAAATPGPFQVVGSGVVDWVDGDNTFTTEWIANRSESREQEDADAAFIAAAWNNLGALVSRVRELEQRCGELETTARTLLEHVAAEQASAERQYDDILDSAAGGAAEAYAHIASRLRAVLGLSEPDEEDEDG